MRKLTTAELVKQRPTAEKLRRLKRFPFSILLDNIRSLENVGLIFRLADALRAEKLYLTGFTGYPCLGKTDRRLPHICERADRVINKTAIKTVALVPWEYHENPVILVKELKKQKITIVSLEQTTISQNYLEVEYRFPLCLIAGHERLGVRDELLKLSNRIIDIPMFGAGNNLNVATAVAIVGYELIKKFVH